MGKGHSAAEKGLAHAPGPSLNVERSSKKGGVVDSTHNDISTKVNIDPSLANNQAVNSKFPIKTYLNLKLDRVQILSEHRGKVSGVSSNKILLVLMYHLPLNNKLFLMTLLRVELLDLINLAKVVKEGNITSKFLNKS